MTLAIVILSFITFILFLYISVLQRQLQSINSQLKKRLKSNSRQPVTVELINKELNNLAESINQCLKAEETLRLESVKEEKRFKELIANISHDLRTPLTAIKGYQQLLEKSTLTDEQREKLGISQKYAVELGTLIEHFFEYSYLLNAEQTLKPEKLNLTNLVTECLATSVNAFEEHGLKLLFEENAPIFVSADREMLVRIFQNLIRNCLAHSAGDVTVRLMTAGAVAFRNPVKDAQEIDTKRMFERFYTGDRARSKTTGLGLAIVKLLTEQMGGTVYAYFVDDQLEIKVELPIYK